VLRDVALSTFVLVGSALREFLTSGVDEFGAVHSLLPLKAIGGHTTPWVKHEFNVRVRYFSS